MTRHNCDLHTKMLFSHPLSRLPVFFPFSDHRRRWRHDCQWYRGCYYGASSSWLCRFWRHHSHFVSAETIIRIQSAPNQISQPTHKVALNWVIMSKAMRHSHVIQDFGRSRISIPMLVSANFDTFIKGYGEFRHSTRARWP